MSQQVNLFNPAFLKQQKIFSAAAMLQALLVLALGSAAMAYYANRNVEQLRKQVLASDEQLMKKKEREALVKTKYLPREKDHGIEARIEAAELELKALQSVSTVIKRGEFGNTAGYSEYFKAFARQSHGNVWLSGLTITGAGTAFLVQGKALDPALVPEYIGRLKREKVMQGSAFDSLKISQVMRPKRTKDGTETTEVAPFVEFSLLSAGMAEPAGGAPK